MMEEIWVPKKKLTRVTGNLSHAPNQIQTQDLGSDERLSTMLWLLIYQGNLCLLRFFWINKDTIRHLPS